MSVRSSVRSRLTARLGIVLMLATQIVVLVSASPASAATTIELVSRTADGTSGNGASTYPSMSHDGNFVAFASTASDIAPGGEETTTPSSDIFVRDRAAGTTEKMLVSSTVAPDGQSYNPWISGDGRFVAFSTAASNLGPDDTNGNEDVYVWDRDTDTFILASVDSAGIQQPSDSFLAAMSDNGRFVLFSTLNPLDPIGDTNTYSDLYLRDLKFGTTKLVSAASWGDTANGNSEFGDVSDDGRWVAFSSSATNLSPATGLTGNIVYLRDMLEAASEGRANGETLWARQPRIAANGSTFVFHTHHLPGHGNLHPDGWRQIVAYDISAASYRLISHSPDGSQDSETTHAGDSHSLGGVTISPDGRFVAFGSQAGNLVAGDTDNANDIFVHDRTTDTIRIASYHPDGWTIATSATSPAISGDGRFTAWQDKNNTYLPSADNPDQNSVEDIWLQDAEVFVPPTIDSFTVETRPAGGEATQITSVPAGLDTVPIADIPLTSIPTDNAGIFAAPVRSIDLAAAPVRSIPVRSIPIRSIPVRSIPVRSIPIRSIAISQLPLDLPGGWAPRLEHTPYDGSPLHTVTLGQLFDLPADGDGNLLESDGGPVVLDDQNASVPHPLEGIALSDLDVSATPIRSISLATIALGSTPIRSIPVRSIDTTTCEITGTSEPTPEEVIANWEALLSCLGFPYDVDEYTTMFELDVSGAPIRSIPIRSIPVRSIDLSASPIRSIPVRSIELAASPVRSIPLQSIALMDTPIRSIPVRSIAVADTPIRSIPVRSIAHLCGVVIDCNHPDVDTDTVEPHQTLGELATKDLTAILSTAELGDLGAALAGYVLGDVPFSDLPEGEGLVTVGQLLDWLNTADGATFEQALGRPISLADILIMLILRTDYPWEELPVADMGLQPVAPAGTVNVQVELMVSGTRNDEASTTITVTLPPGARYAPGSATYVRGETLLRSLETVQRDPAIADGGSALTWTFPSDGAGWSTSIEFQMHPGVRLQQEQLTADVDIETAQASASTAAYDVVERDRGDDDPATAPIIQLDDPSTTTVEARDHLLVGHIAEADDVDYYRIPASLVAGKRLRVDLDTAGVDQDMVMYSPSTAELIDAAPVRSIPVRSIAVEDQGPTAGAEDGTLPPETLQDIPIRSIPVRSISANRGDTNESVDVLTSADDDAPDDYYTIQVSSYNGATSNEPYVLRIRVFDPPGELVCTPRTAPHAAPAPSGTVAAAPQGTGALFVVNRTRISENYGQLTPPNETDLVWAGDYVVDALRGLAANTNDLGMTGHVLVVDDDADVRNAYAAWDGKPCSAAAANAVVDEIVGLVEAAHTSAGGAGYTIPHVVLVGADDVLPQARIPDLTRINERSYTPDVGPNNPIAGALHTEHLLSDDPYGDRDPIPWLNRLLYVPDTALGRLVETPQEIVDTIQRFQTWDGALDPGTADSELNGLVTGYDFLTDGARAVESALTANLDGTVDGTLINESWDSAALDTALLKNTVPNVAAINAHFDHYRSLPAAGNATHDESDLFTTDHIEDGTAQRLDRTLLFSMGCHAGLNVPDVYVAGGDIEDDDWAQTLGRRGAAGYVANTGYGYGDDAAVALSELLMADFAGNLDGSMTVGQALQYAKQSYASQLGVYGAYDEKVMAQATFYGLPMFRMSGAPSTPAGPMPVATTQVATGLWTSEFQEENIPFTEHAESNTTGAARFLTVGNELPQVTHGRPIVPKMDRDATPDNGAPAHGVLLTALSSQEVNVTARFARPVVDHSSMEQPVATDVAFPSTFATVNGYRAPDGPRTNLVLMPGQFIPDEDEGTVGVGTERRFTAMSGVVYYSNSTDVTPPTFSRTSAESNASEVRFEVAVSDDEAAGVQRVLVLYKDGPTPGWKPAELSVDGDGLWRGTGSVSSENVEFLVQAVDAAGNVAATSNKGYLYRAASDVTPPTVEVTSPVAGATYHLNEVVSAEFSCDDDRPGVSCEAELNGTVIADGAIVNTTSATSYTLVVTATDAFGNVTTRSVSFQVAYVFGGFESPIKTGSATPVKAGSSVPVKWQLSDAGGYVSDPSAIVSVVVTKADCASGETLTDELTSTDDTLSGLHYDETEQKWVYIWKTQKGESGCRTLTVNLADGSSHHALFKFK